MSELYYGEKVNNLPSDLVDSEICTHCGRCCFFYRVKEDWLQHFDENTPDKLKLKYDEEIPIKLVEDWDGYHVACGNLEDRQCTIWQNRPKVCAEYNCFESANYGDKQPHIDLGFTAYLIKEIKGIDVDISNVVLTSEDRKVTKK